MRIQHGIVFNALADAEAEQARIDRIAGYPRTEGGLVTEHFVGVRKHPSKEQWMISTDAPAVVEFAGAGEVLDPSWFEYPRRS